LAGAEVSFSAAAACPASGLVAGSLEVDAVVAVEDESIVAAGFVGALCWARPGWPALSMSRTLHTPASELWNCELRCLILGFISVLSLVEVGG
jgi:hypothetical protein